MAVGIPEQDLAGQFSEIIEASRYMELIKLFPVESELHKGPHSRGTITETTDIVAVPFEDCYDIEELNDTLSWLKEDLGNGAVIDREFMHTRSRSDLLYMGRIAAQQDVGIKTVDSRVSLPGRHSVGHFRDGESSRRVVNLRELVRVTVFPSMASALDATILAPTFSGAYDCVRVSGRSNKRTVRASSRAA